MTLSDKRKSLGDWQTPIALASQALTAALSYDGRKFTHALEPTCGRGGFIAAALSHGITNVIGHEISGHYVREARNRFSQEPGVEVNQSDFFQLDWQTSLHAMKSPFLVIGNPPWVTSAELGKRSSSNLPHKSNSDAMTGIEAMTGASNFDISEWMVLRIVEELRGKDFLVALLVKTEVARKCIRQFADRKYSVEGQIRRIDAKQHFDAAVDAVLFVIRNSTDPSQEWPVFDSLDGSKPKGHLGVFGGVLTPNSKMFKQSLYLAGNSSHQWRSGIKHDCSKVFELKVDPQGVIRNGFSEVVDIEDDLLFPMLKSSDVANERYESGRLMLVPQRKIGAPTSTLKCSHPRAWDYLNKYAELLDRRKSSIYRGQPRFSVFGVGDYSFRPWKIAISGFYKKLGFRLIGPCNGKAVVFDDTCYLLSFHTKESALAAYEALQTSEVQNFFLSRVFWDAKRPINKKLLQSLNLDLLLIDEQTTTQLLLV